MYAVDVVIWSNFVEVYQHVYIHFRAICHFQWVCARFTVYVCIPLGIHMVLHWPTLTGSCAVLYFIHFVDGFNAADVDRL